MKGKWYRFKYKICTKINHKWTYYVSGESPQGHYRHCKRCDILQRWTLNIPFYGNIWMDVIPRTKLGAKKFLIEHPEMNYE